MSDPLPESESFLMTSLLGGDDEFLKQLKGSGAANALTFVFFIVLYFIRNKMKHSSCKGFSLCCSCEIKEDEEESDLEWGERREDGFQEGRYVSEQIKEKLFELYSRFHKSLSQKREEIAPTD